MLMFSCIHSVEKREVCEHQYSIGQVLGKGGFGTVYAGVCRKTGKPVSAIFNR